MSLTRSLSLVLPALVDRMGDAKDQVRENSQALILRCMEQAASPMVRNTHLTEMNIKKLTISKTWSHLLQVTKYLLKQKSFRGHTGPDI